MEEKKWNKKGFIGIAAVLLILNVLLLGLLLQKMELLKNYEQQFSTIAEEAEEEEIFFLLPEIIYGTCGSTLEIYNRQVTGLGEEIGRYNVLWNCEIGENLERKFSVTPEHTQQGEYKLSLEIYDNELQLVAQKQCLLVIVEADDSKRTEAETVNGFSEVFEECIDQVKICVDTEYFGDLQDLSPEGIEQMQDVIFAVLCGKEG